MQEMVEKRIVGKVFGAIKGTCSPGDSTNLMGPRPALPKDFKWARKNKSIAMVSYVHQKQLPCCAAAT